MSTTFKSSNERLLNNPLCLWLKNYTHSPVDHKQKYTELIHDELGY